jgi:hypothetical protein
MRWLLLAVFALGCGGSPPAPPETALVLTVNYNDGEVDHWHITGVALASGRPFGPYDAHGSQVQSGQTVGLIFDPSDAGAAMVCVEGREGTTLRVNACGMFEIKANELSQGSIDLQSAH